MMVSHIGLLMATSISYLTEEMMLATIRFGDSSMSKIL